MHEDTNTSFLRVISAWVQISKVWRENLPFASLILASVCFVPLLFCFMFVKHYQHYFSSNSVKPEVLQMGIEVIAILLLLAFILGLILGVILAKPKYPRY